ncbi:SDR family NAD(P)-dependent oxidoreductase [Mucilaginibacter calamicampi]|uniref:SDR family NAD(P)-dependent oxidoreductase n=1 Tax=Mucilaginibacter calamicampi TaxID=1302352 RepID=A0ABW2YTU6_9SPHI
MILVTGATGFLGAEVAKQLAERGELVRCTKRKNSFIPPLLEASKNIEWIDADMLDIAALEQAFEGVDKVYHCAAFVSLKQAHKKRMINANIAGTANVVNLCLDNSARLVHVSSIAAVGHAKPGEFTTENHQLDVNLEDDGYAISKLESEMEVWRGIAEGLDAVIVNPSLIIGPNAGTRGSGQLFEAVRKGLKFYTEGVAGFVDVQDVARCMIALMESDIVAERYIISAENRNYGELTTEIAACFKVAPPTIYAKPWMMEIGWRLARLVSLITGKPPFLDKIAAQAASQVRNFDNSKIKQAIGIEFKPISETVREICESLAP